MNYKNFNTVFFTFICYLLFISFSNAQSTYDEKHIEISLRMIGHQVLLNIGDSTSRVLPIIKEKDRYKIQFDTDFDFDPEELVATVDQVIKETSIARDYILEVEECDSGEIVYGYEIYEVVNSNIIPCGSRELPKCCYSLLITLLDEEGTIVGLNSSNTEDSDVETSSLTQIPIFFLSIMLLGGIYFLWKRKKKTQKDPNIITLGDYHFDKRNTELRLEDQRIELTRKEADLLLLLYSTVNTTVERDVILNMVWGDQGDYVGRTLDVFISKLRKKLEGDSSVKIVNIRGVGYKLVADV